MKKTLFFAALCAIAVMSFSSCSQMTTDEKIPAGMPKAQVDSASYMMGYSFGMSLKYNNFGPLSMAQINKGIKDAMADVEISQQEFSEFINGYIMKRMALIAEENKAKGEAFLAENAKKEGVQTTESGLQYKVVREGGVKPAATDTVEVNYEGTTIEGEVFDSSYERGESVSFPLNRVITGWTEGMQLVGEGGEIMLWIPAELAYGERQQGEKIGPNSTLVFRVELIKVSPAAAATEE